MMGVHRLLNMEGNIMAHASSQQAGLDVTTSAIAANVWRVYEKVGKVAFQQQKLSFISLDCEVTPIYYNFWTTVVGQSTHTKNL